MKMKNATYDRIKAWVIKYLPRIGVFYFTISKIWKLPYGAEVEATVLALCTLLGIAMIESSKTYYDEVKGA